MKIEVKKCDLCLKEYRSDIKTNWSDCVDRIELNMASHAAIQFRWDKDVCSSCAYQIRDAISAVIDKLTKKEKQ